MPPRPPAEFDLIDRWFRRGAAPAGAAAGVVLGIGDDAALLAQTPGLSLVVSTDTLVEGVHFPVDTPPADVGWKALAVNLSDLAAMGAQPRGCLLALSLPSVDEAWLEGFARGFRELADAAQCPLVGGDTTSMPAGAPRVITVTVLGEVAADDALRRDGAQVGDLVCVSGITGEAALGLARWHAGARDAQDVAIRRLLRPQPRLALGMGLRGVATAAIDVSDGLLADLAHVLEASSRARGVTLGAELHLAALAGSSVFANEVEARVRDAQLAGGDDYELCFTVPASALKALQVIAANAQVPVQVIGRITADGALRCLDADGRAWQPPRRGWEHFRA